MAEKEQWKTSSNFCYTCNIVCSSGLQLCEHVMGQKHRAVTMRVSPESVPHLHRFQYFIDSYMESEPLVGLEYVEEWQTKVQYQYWCVLCKFRGQRKPIYLHITGADHIAMYAKKHHPELLPQCPKNQSKAERQKAMQQVAVKIYQDYGQKTISEIPDDDAKPPPKKLAKYSSDPQSVRNPAIGDERLDGFKGNADFLVYLQKFQIQSDKDAKIIQLITQNCTQALLSFWQEHPMELRGQERRRKEELRGQERRRKEELRGQDRRRKEERRGHEPRRKEESRRKEELRGQEPRRKEELRGQEPLRGEASRDSPAPANKTDEGFSVGNCGKVVPGSAPQTDATQVFFNSIKNMEEAEVRDILQKIAATNPAFRGIDVPNVIKYLQATGRLKT